MCSTWLEGLSVRGWGRGLLASVFLVVLGSKLEDSILENAIPKAQRKSHNRVVKSPHQRSLEVTLVEPLKNRIQEPYEDYGRILRSGSSIHQILLRSAEVHLGFRVTSSLGLGGLRV